jgi:hypothetical protein
VSDPPEPVDPAPPEVTEEPAVPPLVVCVLDVVELVPVEPDGFPGELDSSPQVTTARLVNTKASPPNNCKFRFIRDLRSLVSHRRAGCVLNFVQIRPYREKV